MVLELLGLGAGSKPDLIIPIDQRGYKFLGTGQGVSAFLQLGIVLAVELADPRGSVPVLDELGDEPVGSLAHLVVDPRSWRPRPYFLEGLRPGLDVQVVGVHERSVYVQEHRLYQSHPPPSSRLTLTSPKTVPRTSTRFWMASSLSCW